MRPEHKHWPGRFLRALSGSALVALTGCASAPEIPLIPKLPAPRVIVETVYVPVYLERELPEPEPVVIREPARLPEEQAQALALLLDMARLVQAGAEELRRELAAATAAFNRERTPILRLRLVWISMLVGPAAGDDARLQALIEPLVGRNATLAPSHPLRPIAELVQASLAERMRQVREETRKAEALQQKLDALRAIERQLLERERRRN
ncbi:MAG: hypothetical protein NZ533_05335 [Casimicrobiaceae bacterium]|nr:hypothetical protein [Casimicrobiaceae bacterium]MCX8098834.1 hypothetical protein [Casimicrobiaceae bacterium]MDW8311513.1 hypothetical protein [Burkholderiales bacterium]